MAKNKAEAKLTTSTPISSIKHEKESRVNIPTEELRDFMPDDEKAAKKKVYPRVQVDDELRKAIVNRDMSLDPQLVWKGKDEQDSKPLEVLTVPIYIQEKVHPQAIIENLRETAKAGELEPELSLFNDFNGIKFEDQIEFYKHEQHWQNRMILGDSLLVMNSLAEKEQLKGKVQMIYFDPPYGIKFGSNWQVNTNRRDVKDGKADHATRQPEQVKAFRDTWKDGIHSYLSYLRERLVVAQELLAQSGSIFVQISDQNHHLLRALLDEVCGTENYCATISFRKTTTQSGDFLADTNDYILWYAKDRSLTKQRVLFQEREGTDWVNYDYLAIDGEFRRMTTEERKAVPTNARVYRRSPLTSASASATTLMPVPFRGKDFKPGKGGWKTNLTGMHKLLKADRLESYGETLSYRRYSEDFPYFEYSNAWTDTASGGYGDDKVYVVQTNAKVIARCMMLCTDPGDIVLDPTCGSGTSAYVAEQWGRRWITIDTSRVALALARTRLMAAKFPYYTLKDKGADIRHGFNYKPVPHITLKSIANNAEIDLIYEKYQQQMEPLRAEYNKLTKQKLEEWEMPRITDETSAPQKGKNILEQWWQLRRTRQQEIDASIARRADVEYLYDQPEEDKKRIRVTGPFTVESLSPHRVLETKETPIGGAPEVAFGPGETDVATLRGDKDFVSVIIENLKKAGIQNTRRNERLKFDRIELASGPYLQAKGFYIDAENKERMVAIAIGPEHGTVSSDLIDAAATETAKARPKYDSLYVLGFSFDAGVNLEREKFGALPINMAHMNPDLSMGDELLKKTGAGNLFMVFGEPDIKLEKTSKGLYKLTIDGVDIYDPTTGQVRSNSTDDIACWFVDTNYNEKSFFVRHAYFLGDKDPYEKLKRAMRSEIDEGTWSTLYSNESRPFEVPSTGKIAVKVINMYGDEVMKVYNVD